MASRGDLTLDTTTCEFQAGIAVARIALCLVPLTRMVGHIPGVR